MMWEGKTVATYIVEVKRAPTSSNLLPAIGQLLAGAAGGYAGPGAAGAKMVP